MSRNLTLTAYVVAIAALSTLLLSVNDVTDTGRGRALTSVLGATGALWLMRLLVLAAIVTLIGFVADEVGTWRRAGVRLRRRQKLDLARRSTRDPASVEDGAPKP